MRDALSSSQLAVLWLADMNAEFINTQNIFKDVHPPTDITRSALENRREKRDPAVLFPPLPF